MKRIVIFTICIISNQIISQTKLKKTDNKIDSIQKLDEVIINSNLIFGNKFVASYRTGSAYYISPKGKSNIYFAGIDFIQEKLIGDINVTSPTGLAAYKNLSGVNLAKIFWNNI